MDLILNVLFRHVTIKFGLNDINNSLFDLKLKVDSANSGIVQRVHWFLTCCVLKLVV